MATSFAEMMSPCRLCPRECGAWRDGGGIGFCGVGATALVGSSGPHFGEERVLVGGGGSGTIFLAGCNLGCCFCQNPSLSHRRQGIPTEPAEMARVMMKLEALGCVNVNFVTPTHFAPPIAEAIRLARSDGMTVPVVYNCGGYESLEALRELEGLVEIYMPDAKTMDRGFAEKAFGAPDYPERMPAAVAEMHRQVGDLEAPGGVASRGVLVRHLVMPGMTEDSGAVVEMLAGISPRTYVNVMGQYRPCWQADRISGLDRRPTETEISAAKARARGLGLRLAE